MRVLCLLVRRTRELLLPVVEDSLFDIDTVHGESYLAWWPTELVIFAWVVVDVDGMDTGKRVPQWGDAP